MSNILYKELANGSIVEFSKEDYEFLELPEIRPTETAVRNHRDNLLRNKVDPVVSNFLRWSSMPEIKQQEWSEYRQNLLDVTTQEGFPTNVVWPTKPTEGE